MGSCIGQDFYLFSVPASKRTGNRLKSQFFKVHPATVRAVFVYYSPRENLFCVNSLTEASHKNRTQLSSLLRQVTFERSAMTHQGTLWVRPSEWKQFSWFEFNRENGTKANVVNLSWVNCLKLKFFIFHYHSSQIFRRPWLAQIDQFYSTRWCIAQAASFTGKYTIDQPRF